LTGKIIVDGVDANQREQSVEDRAAYAQAEEKARASKRGLWKDADPAPPWDWRKQQKKKD
jgi:endonuclease YncB( thermonuclease family)